MFDVFFLSFDEPTAEVHWQHLQTSVANARRVSGVPGIAAAHRACAEQARTAMLWVIDADNEVLSTHDFGFQPPKWDREYVHLWYARNPLNGLEYGWGGIKLFPRTLLRSMDHAPRMDLTTSFGLKIIPTLASVTHFNTSPFATWRSAFREATKLSLAKDETSTARLQTWMNMANGPFAEYCIEGARGGHAFATSNVAAPDRMHMINDFAFLRTEFNRVFP